jgi:parallel beta-helix repeat protein
MLRRIPLTVLFLIPAACSSAQDAENTATTSESAVSCKNPTAGMTITANTTLCAGTFNMNTPAGAAAITIGADKVTVTCNQTVLQGPGPSGATAVANVGFNIVGRKTVTLKGCTAKGFQYGAVVKNSSAVTLDTVHLDGNFTDPSAQWVYDAEQGGGVRVENTTSSTIKNSTMTQNWNGIELRGSSTITVTGNKANHVNNVGLVILASNNNTVTSNDFSYAVRGDMSFGAWTFDSAGILLDGGATGNLIQSNNATYGGDGIFLKTHDGPCADGNRIIGNDTSYSPNNCIESWCDHNVFSNNTANYCNYGIWLGASDYLTVTGNTAKNNNTDGMSIQGGSDRHGLIQDNVLQNNGNDGMYLSGMGGDGVLRNSSHLIVQRNTVSGNVANDVYTSYTHGATFASNSLSKAVVTDPNTTAYIDTSVGTFSGATGRTPPTAALATPPATVGMNTPITFDASASKLSASGGTLAFRWLVQSAGEVFASGQEPPVVFGGVSTSKPSVTFTRPGTYDIDVTVTDGFLGALANQSITVLPTGTRVGETASTWTYQCSTVGDTCSTTTFVDETGGMDGTDVHVTTGALFDFAAITPKTKNLALNATSLHYLGFYIKGKNTNDGGWQGGEPYNGVPTIILGGPNGTLTYEPNGAVLVSSDGTTWSYVEVPLAGGNGWTVTNNGGSLSSVNWVEIHANTYGGGFDLWFDTVTFY